MTISAVRTLPVNRPGTLPDRPNARRRPVEPFGLVVRFVLKPGTGEGFDALMRETLVGIRDAEPNTLMYAVHAVQGEPDVRVFYELYRSVDALAEHEAQPTTGFFLDRRDEFVASYTVDRLIPLAAKGIDTLAAGLS
jgi:quinol monooxygenase YgiN